MGGGDEDQRHRADRFSCEPGDVEVVRVGGEAVLPRSDGSRNATRASLARLSAQPAGYGEVALRNADGRFAKLAASDLPAGSLRVVDHETGEAVVFADAVALPMAGWVLD